jgi:RNA polymerase sigma-70 factor (ECF subfamily)
MTATTDERDTMKPRELVVLAQAGDDGAFADLVRQYRGLVFAVCFQQTGSFLDSEELTQEVFLAAHGGLASIREPEKIAAWLQGIARNLSRMHRRRAGMETLELPPELPDGEAPSRGSTSAVRSLELQNLLHEALSRVTEHSREVLALHYLGGYDYREIGELCNLAVQTVRSRLHEGRAQLKARLLEKVAELCACSGSSEHTTRCVLERCGKESCDCVSRLDEE